MAVPENKTYALQFVPQVIERLIWGLTLPARASLLLFRSPKLWLISSIPVLITFVLYFLAFGRMRDALRTAVYQWLHIDPASTTGGILYWVIQVLLLVACAVSFSVVSAIVASPFLDTIAEMSESRVSPKLPEAPKRDLKGWIKLILLDAVKSVFFLGATLLLLALSWIPGVGFISIALGPLLMSFQYLVYPQTRRAQGLTEGLRFLTRNFPEAWGLGAVLTVLFSIPLLSSFLLPIAAISGTWLFARDSREQLKK